jgi:hypothetical protein
VKLNWIGLCTLPLLTAGAAHEHQVDAVLSSHERSAMEQFIGCPFAGAANPHDHRVAEANRLKNRFEAPTHFARGVTLDALAAPGLDQHRWANSLTKGVRITGFVAFAVKNPSGESCNCFKRDDAHSDTHIDLVQDPKDSFSLAQHVVVEVTPRMKYLARLRGLDWSTTGLQRQFSHRWVTVEGWLFWDGENARVAANTHPIDPEHRNWRRTCWEVHPVTSIVLAPKS